MNKYTKNKTIKLALCSLVLTSGVATNAMASKVIEQSFYPYKTSKPQVEGVTPGTKINQSNWQLVKDVLNPETLEFVKTGQYEFTVGETTSFDLHSSYVKATEQRLGSIKLGDNVGQITGADAGRPFPQEPSLDDPRAGEKLAWNFKYGYNWGDSAAIYPFYWKFRNMSNGKTERSLKFNFHFLNFTHRVKETPIPAISPNPSNLFRSTYVQVLEPFDVKNTQLLIHRFEDDLKRDNAYLYLGFQRRVRRLSAGQVTDAFLGSDLMIEDFEGYNGRIADMNWHFKGTQTLLMPFYNHNDMVLDQETHKDKEGYQVVAFGGKGQCFPQITWQLRKVHVVEAVPTDENHPISKRVHYIDAQTFTVPITASFDRKGDLWKQFTIGQSHPDHHLAKNKGSGVSIDDSFSMIDVQAQHCTTGQFKGQVDPKLNPASKFTVQNMRASGR